MEPKYDVAISFISQDESVAHAFYEGLSAGLEVFFYPRNQEDLAGTVGLESMRSPFYNDSRVVVVLFREPWGRTPWTGVEQTAIMDGCLRYGWKRLFFVMLDKASQPPVWLPDSHVRFNYADFGLEQAIGAIKARVQETGGILAPPSAEKRAELYANDKQYQSERRILRSSESRPAVSHAASQLFGLIKKRSTDVVATRNFKIDVMLGQGGCHLRNDRVSLAVILTDRDFGMELVIAEYDKRLAVGNEHLFYPDGGPTQVSESKFSPDMNRAGEVGWVDNAKDSSGNK